MEIKEKLHKSDICVIVPVGQVDEIQNDFLTHLDEILSQRIDVILIITSRDSGAAKEKFETLTFDYPKTLRIFFFDFCNQGLARNIGIQLAKSEWVAFLDDDDSLELENLLELQHLAKQDNSDIGVGAIRVINAQSMKSRTHSLAELTPITDNIGVFPAFTRMIYRRSFIKDSRFAELKMGEDQVFLLSVFSNHPKISVTDLVIYNYKVNTSGQITKNFSSSIDLRHSIILCLDYENGDIRLKFFFIYRQYLSLVKFGLKGRLQSLFYLGIRILLESFRHPIITVDVCRQIIRLRESLL